MGRGTAASHWYRSPSLRASLELYIFFAFELDAVCLKYLKIYDSAEECVCGWRRVGNVTLCCPRHLVYLCRPRALLRKHVAEHRSPFCLLVLSSEDQRCPFLPRSPEGSRAPGPGRPGEERDLLLVGAAGLRPEHTSSRALCSALTLCGAAGPSGCLGGVETRFRQRP